MAEGLDLYHRVSGGPSRRHRLGARTSSTRTGRGLMRYRELVSKLRRLGCERLRQAGGSHEIWWRPGTDRRTVVPCHPSREIPTGTLHAILRDHLGLTIKDLRKR